MVSNNPNQMINAVGAVGNEAIYQRHMAGNWALLLVLMIAG